MTANDTSYFQPLVELWAIFPEYENIPWFSLLPSIFYCTVKNKKSPKNLQQNSNLEIRRINKPQFKPPMPLSLNQWHWRSEFISWPVVVVTKFGLCPDHSRSHLSWCHFLKILQEWSHNPPLDFSPHGPMIPTDVFAQTPTAPQRDKLCACCSITSDAFNRFFHSEPSSETKLSLSESPRETIVSLQTNSFDINGCQADHEGDYPAGAMLASASNDNYYNDDQDLYSKSQVRKRLTLTSLLPGKHWSVYDLVDKFVFA